MSNNNNSCHKKIVNRSGLILDKSMISLLNKGLSYVPDKEKENISEIISDLELWRRRLKLKLHFKESNTNNCGKGDKWRSKPTSKTWCPKSDKLVDAYVDKVK